MITLSGPQLDRLFPAHIVADTKGCVVTTGPSLKRLLPELASGSLLFDHLQPPAGIDAIDLGEWAACQRTIQLRTPDNRLALAGAVIESGVHFLLALNHSAVAHTPSGQALSMADFAPSDPTVSTLMQVMILQSLLDEADDNAQMLEREQRRTVELVDRIKRSSGYLAHDYNNMISIIELNCLNALKAEELTPDHEHRVRVILESAYRSSELTRVLMAVAKQPNDSGLAEDIDALVMENLAYLRMIAGARINLSVDLQSAPHRVKISRSGLINCLTSLLMNSRDAFGSKHGEATISSTVDEAGSQIILTVADTGPGMEAGILESAFEAFFSTKAGASGMGLTSVIDFAQEAGGDAKLESVPGHGTQVHLYLPITASEEQPTGAQTQMSAHPGPRDIDIGSDRILVVDDEPYALEALAELLVDEGYCVTAKGSAAEAMAALEAGTHDILLTDVVMPDCDGLQLARQARGLQPGIRIIVMSGYMPDSLDMEDDWLFLRKPLNVDALQSLIAANSTD